MKEKVTGFGPSEIKMDNIFKLSNRYYVDVCLKLHFKMIN